MAGEHAWVKEPFRDFVKYVEDVTRLVEVSTLGLSALLVVPSAAQLLNIVQKSEANSPEDIEKLRGHAAMARQEKDAGFPLLYAHATISIWTALETLTKEFAIAWLRNEPSAMKTKAVRDITISLSDYHTMSEVERYEYICEKLETQKLDGKSAVLHKQGVNRFENILNALGIGGSVEKTIRETLWELSNIRNVLIHRRSIADKRLVDACPSLLLSIGDKVTITPEKFNRYANASIDYANTILTRVGDYYGYVLPSPNEEV